MLEILVLVHDCQDLENLGSHDHSFAGFIYHVSCVEYDSFRRVFIALLSAIKWRETWRAHVGDFSVHVGDSRGEYVKNLGFTTLILDSGCMDLVVLSVVDNVACRKSRS